MRVVGLYENLRLLNETSVTSNDCLQEMCKFFRYRYSGCCGELV